MKRKLFACVVVCLSFLFQHLNAQSVTEFFNTSFGFPTTNNVIAPAPEAARLADLDNDGDLDAVVANGNFNSGFSVLLNDGYGKYISPVQYTTGFASWDIVVADFTGDSIPDVVVTNTGTSFNGNTISLFPGNGNGTFSAKTNYTVGSGPLGVAAADFNIDGFMDLVVANNGGFGTGTTLSVLINNTSGGFNAAVTITGIAKPYKVAAAFMDSDSLPDIVVANEEEQVTMLHNTGSGFLKTIYSMQNQQFNNLFSSVQLADIDNDSDLDVFYSSLGTQNISLRKNMGNGVLDSIEMIVLDFIYGGTASFQVVDLNADGFKDIVAATSTGSTGDGFRIVLNQGNGTFGPETIIPGGQRTFVILTGDVDLDGDNDIVTADNYSNELTVHQNNGAGSFPTPVLFSNGLPIVSTKLDAADIDNDGDLDILTGADSRTAINVPVTVIKNNGNGTFAAGINISAPQGGVGAKFRDINNDGFQDIIYASGINTSPYDFFTAINNGNGTFAPVVRWSVNSCGWNDMDAADLDNDGDIDVVLTEWLGCPSVPFSSQRIFISYNNGGGNFSAAVPDIVNSGPGPIAICDFNEDGFLDLATGQTSYFDIHLNDGTGNFLAPVSFTMSQSPFDILATDLNNDGHTDIASCNYGSNPGDYNLTIRLGNGDGTFQNVQLIDAAYSPDLANVSGIAAGDVDNDGDVDLMVSQNATNDMSIYINNGSGVFSFDHRLCVYYGFRSPWFADFNGDGIKDLAGLVSLPPDGLSSALTVLPGNTTGTATGGAGLSACGTTVTAIESNTAVSKNISLLIAPNPFTDFATVTFTTLEKGNYSLLMINSMGQKVAETEGVFSNAGTQKITLSRKNLPAGIYKLQVITSEEVFKSSFVLE